MGRSSLYHYYPDKQCLVGDLVQDLVRDEQALFAAALEGPGGERIEPDVIRRFKLNLIGSRTVSTRNG